MHMRIWSGHPGIVQSEVNKFLQGKALDKSVIIHTHFSREMVNGQIQDTLTVVIFHAETDLWMERTQ